MIPTPSYYTYFISSLPMLHFGTQPPFSFEKFLEKCKGILSEGDIEVIKKSASFAEPALDTPEPALKRWREFDAALRNELVRIRAGRKKLDPTKYLRGEKYVESHISAVSTAASRNPSILESEIMLDGERWRFLDELRAGHYFDIDFLIIYALKLLILERWARIHGADKARMLEEALSGSVK